MTEVNSLGQSPPASALLLSVVAHLLASVLLVVVWHAARVRVVPAKYASVQAIPAAASVSFNSKPARSEGYAAHGRAHPRRPRLRQAASTAGSETGRVLWEHARRETVAITNDLRFHMIYGFSPNHQYQLAVQTGGELPVILESEVPPHFQQYVIIEVTIDTEGRVAQARIVAGLVDSAIQQKLLSAIRDFKYTPAKRDGYPIPSQRDIVIHIPT